MIPYFAMMFISVRSDTFLFSKKLTHEKPKKPAFEARPGAKAGTFFPQNNMVSPRQGSAVWDVAFFLGKK
ncbi:MAG: hypothetical protein D6714_07280 [Bacteroidetes bacterium]|nr:MAG: hypothetical protein D6714_07280 [Bacteroidota bacterium]